MGSFNTSCFVSRQTIATGDACKVMPISQARTYREVELTHGDRAVRAYGHTHSTCYPTCFWEPASGFFDAVYDDYGKFTLSDTDNNRDLLVQFLGEALRHVPNVALGENTSHDIPCDLRGFMASNTPRLLACYGKQAAAPAETADPDLLWPEAVQCWDYLWEVAREARLFWSDYSGVLRPMGFAVMHQTAFDELVAMTNAWVGYGGESYEMRVFFQRALDDVKAWAVKREEKRLATQPLEERNARLESYFAFDKLRNAMERVGGNVRIPYASDYSQFDEVYDDYSNGKLSDDALFELVKPSLELRYACSGLESLNLHFEPMVYAGQDYSNEVGVSYAKLVQSVARKVTRGRDVHCYGEFIEYSVLARDPQVFEHLSKKAHEYDGALNLLRTETSSEDSSRALVIFECTLPRKYVLQLLKDYATENDDAGILRSSLQRAKLSAADAEADAQD